MSVPLLLLSDSASGTSGLGRICRDLALRIHEHMSDVFDVAVFGYGAPPSEELPFLQFEMKCENSVPTNLPECWQAFAGKRHGVLLSIFNISWCPYLADPERFATGELREFLLTKPFERWAYPPIDGDCRPGVLPLNMAEAIYGFDRVAHYTNFAKRITDNALAELGKSMETAVLPHGLDTSVFYPRDRAEARRTFFTRATGGAENPIKSDVKMIGVVATNSERKNFSLVFESAAELVNRGINVGLWIHTDAVRKYWDMIALAREYKLGDRIVYSKPLTDEGLAWCYSAMDVCWGPGNEGWGMPLAESLGCGIPTIHMSYGGGADFVPHSMQVDPVAFHHQGFFGIRKPVFRPEDWVDVTQDWISDPIGDVKFPDYIKWDNAWPEWENWLRAGLQDGVDCKHTEVGEVVTSE